MGNRRVSILRLGMPRCGIRHLRFFRTRCTASRWGSFEVETGPSPTSAGVAAAVNMPRQRVSDFAPASRRSGHAALKKTKMLMGAYCYDASLTVCTSISTLSFRQTALKMVARLSKLKIRSVNPNFQGRGPRIFSFCCRYRGKMPLPQKERKRLRFFMMTENRALWL